MAVTSDRKLLDSTPDLKKSSSLQAMIHRLIRWQLGLTLFFSASLVWIDQQIALSILLGGLIIIVPGGLLAVYWSTRNIGFTQLVLGEAGKLGISAVLFAVIFLTVEPLKLAYFFGAVAVNQLMIIGVASNRLTGVKQTDEDLNDSGQEKPV